MPPGAELLPLRSSMVGSQSKPRKLDEREQTAACSLSPLRPLCPQPAKNFASRALLPTTLREQGRTSPSRRTGLPLCRLHRCVCACWCSSPGAYRRSDAFALCTHNHIVEFSHLTAEGDSCPPALRLLTTVRRRPQGSQSSVHQRTGAPVELDPTALFPFAESPATHVVAGEEKTRGNEQHLPLWVGGEG